MITIRDMVTIGGRDEGLASRKGIMVALYSSMKAVEVGCSIILREGKILIAQRPPGTYLGGYWEFPGGKREAGETIEKCLVREVFEELGIWIRPRSFLCRTDHAYPDKRFSLFFYLCDWVSGRPMRHGCLDFRWVVPEELRRFRFPLGDDVILNELIRKKSYYFK